jgi:hypothetical protein
MARSKGHHVQAHAGHMLVLLNDEDFELAKWNAGFDQFRVPFYSPTKCHMQRNPDEIDNIFELAEFSERGELGGTYFGNKLADHIVEEKSDSGPVIRPTKGLITQNGIVSVSFTHDAVGIVGVTV